MRLISNAAAAVVAAWGFWAVADAHHQQHAPRPALPAAVAIPAPPAAPIPDRSGLTYWPGP